MDGRPLPGSAAQRRRASWRATRRAGLGISAALALLLLLPAAAPAATPGDVVWSHTWSTSAGATTSDVLAAGAPAGGLYVAATVRRGGGRDIVVQRYDASGKRLWTRWYRGPAGGADRVTGIAAGPDGSVTLCGSTAVTGAGTDWLVLRYGSGGALRWVKRLAGAAGRNDRPAAVAVDSRGDTIVTGSIWRARSGIDWCTARYAPNGFRRWRAVTSTTGIGDDHPNALALTSSGRIFVAGQFWSKTKAEDAVVAAYTAKGRLVWRRVWQGLGPSNDAFTALAAGADGVAAAGSTHGALGAGDGLVVSYRQDGTLRWSVAADGGADPSGLDRFVTVAVRGNGDVVAGGVTTASAASGADAVVAAFAEADGSESARWRWDGGPDDAVLCLALDGGDVLAAGRAGRAGAREAIIAGLTGGLSTLWPPAVIPAAEARALVVVPGGILAAGLRGDDLLVARIAR